jgi:hypothetical protein
MMINKIEIIVEAIADATRKAFIELFKNNEKYYYCVLLTTGEALPPCISAWSWEALNKMSMQYSEEYAQVRKWSYADSPYYAFGEEYFDEVKRLFEQRPNMDYFNESLWNEEFNFRLMVMELAIKKLDNEGLFELNQPRKDVYINVELMPPDSTNTERALRLNKKENITNWLLEASEDN